VIILDTLVIGGLRFVLRRLAEAVDAELNDVDVIREDLLAAQMRLELGEITAGQFAEVERDLLARLREIRERTAGDDGSPMRITGIEVDIADGVEDGADGPPGR
jgi:gas vesicle protein GvpG